MRWLRAIPVSVWVAGVVIWVALLAIVVATAQLLATPAITPVPSATYSSTAVGLGTVVPSPIAAPSGTPQPGLTVTPAPDISALVDAELSKVTEGVLAFNPPATMTVGQIERVEVSIQRLQLGFSSTLTVTQALTQGFVGKGVPTVEPIKTYPFMTARLEGDSFDIKSLTDEEQTVSAD